MISTAVEQPTAQAPEDFAAVVQRYRDKMPDPRAERARLVREIGRRVWW